MGKEILSFGFKVVEGKCSKCGKKGDIIDTGDQEIDFLICKKCGKYKWFSIYDKEYFALLRCIQEKFGITLETPTYEKGKLYEKYLVPQILFTLIKYYMADPCECGGEWRYQFECNKCGGKLDKIGKVVIRRESLDAEKLTHKRIGRVTKKKIEELCNFGVELWREGKIDKNKYW